MNTDASLSEAETRYFLAALDAPFTPNARLQRAMDAAAQLTRNHSSPKSTSSTAARARVLSSGRPIEMRTQVS